MSKVEPQDFGLRYGGRVLALHIYINTDQDFNKMAKRVQRVARGLRNDAIVCWVEGYEGENGRVAWEAMQEVVVRMAANPNSQPVDLEGSDE